MMIGSTHYLHIGGCKDCKGVAVYYPSDREVHMRIQDAKILKGQMDLKDVGYNVRWCHGPRNYYNIAEHMGAFIYIGANGKPAGTITKIISGNPESF